MSLPVCPHCKHEFSQEEIYYTGATHFPTTDDDETNETKCLSCDMPLTIVLSLSPSWSFVDEDGEEIS